MKIDESFRDCKSLLNLTQAMNKRRENLEKMIALTRLFEQRQKHLLAYYSEMSELLSEPQKSYLPDN